MKRREIELIINKIKKDPKLSTLSVIKNFELANEKQHIIDNIITLYNNKYKILGFNNNTSPKLVQILLIMIIIDFYLLKLDTANNKYTQNIKKMLNNVKLNDNNIPSHIESIYFNKIEELDLKLYNINQLK